MTGLLLKDGVLPIQTIAPAGFRILAALDGAARRMNVSLTITCADKDHPESDPHSVGEAYDVRTHGFSDDEKLRLLRVVMGELQEASDPMDSIQATSGGLATLHFFGWIEHPGEPTEHLHVQRRKGTVFALGQERIV